MPATSRPSDLVRNHVINNVLDSYRPAVMWDESEATFTDKSASICCARQEGRPVDTFLRVHDVQVWLFSKANATLSDCDSLFDDANRACDYLMNGNFRLAGCEIAAPVIEHVTGPYKTKENRYFYRFTVRVRS